MLTCGQSGSGPVTSSAPTREQRDGIVTIYTLYIHDGRYGAPALLVVELADDDLVLAFAAERLTQSVYYRAVEIWDGDRRVGQVEHESDVAP